MKTSPATVKKLFAAYKRYARGHATGPFAKTRFPIEYEWIFYRVLYTKKLETAAVNPEWKFGEVMKTAGGWKTTAMADYCVELGLLSFLCKSASTSTHKPAPKWYALQGEALTFIRNIRTLTEI